MKKYLFFTLLFLVCFTKVKSQINKVVIELPDALKNEMPFLKNEFYEVLYSEDAGEDGMFVFTIDKSLYLNTIKVQLTSKLKSELSRLGFLNRTCHIGRHTCGREYKDLLDFTFTVSEESAVVENYSTLKCKYSTKLRAREHNVYWSQNWRLHCDREHDYGWYNLLRGSLTLNQNFEFQSPLRLTGYITVNGEGRILYDGCSIMSGNRAYLQKRDITLPEIYQSLRMTFNRLDPGLRIFFSSLMLNTREVKILEDKSNYYVYCIRQTI